MRRREKKKKKNGAKNLESVHLDGAGSARGFGFAAAGSVPEPFFVAPRNAPRISQPVPGAPFPERAGPPRPGSSRSCSAPSWGKFVPSPGGIPRASPHPQQPLMFVGNPQTKQGGCRCPLTPAVPPGPPATRPLLGDLGATLATGRGWAAPTALAVAVVE